MNPIKFIKPFIYNNLNYSFPFPKGIQKFPYKQISPTRLLETNMMFFNFFVQSGVLDTQNSGGFPLISVQLTHYSYQQRPFQRSLEFVERNFLFHTKIIQKEQQHILFGFSSSFFSPFCDEFFQIKLKFFTLPQIFLRWKKFPLCSWMK